MSLATMTLTFTKLTNEFSQSFFATQVVLWTCFLAVLATFVTINGTTGYRLLERGIINRYHRPPRSDIITLPGGASFKMSCHGAGPSTESDVVVLLDSDIASSSIGYGWLTLSLSRLWKTCMCVVGFQAARFLAYACVHAG